MFARGVVIVRSGLLATMIWLVAGLGLVVPGASAHQLGTDGSMTVVLHVDSDDSPLAGTPTTLHLYYGSTDPGIAFNMASCSCTVAVAEGTKVVKQGIVTPLPGVSTEATLGLTFPKVDVYTVTVTGRSTIGSFPAFRIVLSLRVDQSAIPPTNYTWLYEQFGLGAAAVVAVVSWVVSSGRRRRARRREATTT
jgi:hypothetical protein